MTIKIKQKFTLKIIHLNLAISMLFLGLYNFKFWREVNAVIKPSGLMDYLFVGSIFLLLLLLINLILNLLCSKYSYKIVYGVLFLSAASSVYFISQYGIYIDRDMVQNIVETRPAEAKDLMSLGMLMYLLVLGVLPIVLISKVAVQFGSFKQELLSKIKLFVASIVLIVVLLFVNYASFASFARNNRQISHLIVPTNSIFATISYIKQKFKSSNIPLKIITLDAKLSPAWEKINNKTVLILVIGETARADHFGLDGYEKNTTPNLSKRELVNFTQTYSCGTSTAISLPCIFSHLGREDYSHKIAKNTENILDFFTKTDFFVQWRDNNTGCKGICDRATLVDLTDVPGDPLCETGECFDEILLKDLQQQIIENPKNQIIVLHQKGSHGPSYYLRYPEEFEQFKPVCRNNQLQKCSRSELYNTYDNTILYTDYFLDKSIELLENLPSDYNSSLIYISDHGESLGENNLYLHGTPYFLAPDAQIHIPFFTWMSDSFVQEFAINMACLKSKESSSLSHDNVFHSLLGLMRIKTSIYDSKLDIFNSCRVH